MTFFVFVAGNAKTDLRPLQGHCPLKMPGNKQVKTLLSIVLATCLCLYTFLSMQPVRKRVMLSSVSIKGITHKEGEISNGLENSVSTNRRFHSLRPRTVLTIKNAANCPDCNDRNHGLKMQSSALTMGELDAQLRKHVQLNSEQKYLSLFRPKFQDRQVAVLSKIMAAFDKLMVENGMTYFLYGGSLIGSFRHHGLIPWDDDADVMVSFSNRLRLHRLLETLDPHFSVSFHPVHYWKLYHKAGEEIQGFPWKWPFLDIFFYDQNETHIWDTAPQYTHQFTFSKSTVFPPRRRPFMGMSMFGPNDPQTVMSQRYNISECSSGGYVHRWERRLRSTIVPCSWLHRVFPFVDRVYMNGGCNETLVYRGKIIGVYFDWGVQC